MKKENTGKIVTYTYDPDNPPPEPDAEYLARLDAMTDEAVYAAALTDPDNPPMRPEERGTFRRVVPPDQVRKSLALTQKEFAKTYGLSLATLKDWEQKRFLPDTAARNYLHLIAVAPEFVAEALKKKPPV